MATPKKKREHIEISYDENNTAKTEPAAKVSSVPVPLRQFALFPSPGDNCAVCTKKVDAGVQLILEGDSNDKPVRLSHSVLEGHRYKFYFIFSLIILTSKEYLRLLHLLLL